MRNFWFCPPCFRKPMILVPWWNLPPSTSRTIPVPLLTVKSSSKCHFWLLPPWGLYVMMGPPWVAPEMSRTRLKQEKLVKQSLPPTSSSFNFYGFVSGQEMSSFWWRRVKKQWILLKLLWLLEIKWNKQFVYSLTPKINWLCCVSGLSMWFFRWTNWNWDNFSPNTNTLVSSVSIVPPKFHANSFIHTEVI